MLFSDSSSPLKTKIPSTPVVPSWVLTSSSDLITSDCVYVPNTQHKCADVQRKMKEMITISLLSRKKDLRIPLADF